jgi:hypothetical protein
LEFLLASEEQTAEEHRRQAEEIQKQDAARDRELQLAHDLALAESKRAESEQAKTSATKRLLLLVGLAAVCVASLALFGWYQSRRALLAEAATREHEQLGRRSAFNTALRRVQAVITSDPVSAYAELIDPEVFPPGLRESAWRLLVRQADREILSFQAHDGPVTAIAADPAGQRLAMIREPSSYGTCSRVSY